MKVMITAHVAPAAEGPVLGMAPVGRDVPCRLLLAERDLAATLEGPLRPSSSAGKWLGGGAHGLGLVGTCEPAQLAAVLEGRRPGGGACS